MLSESDDGQTRWKELRAWAPSEGQEPLTPFGQLRKSGVRDAVTGGADSIKRVMIDGSG